MNVQGALDDRTNALTNDPKVPHFRCWHSFWRVKIIVATLKKQVEQHHYWQRERACV